MLKAAIDKDGIENGSKSFHDQRYSFLSSSSREESMEVIAVIKEGSLLKQGQYGGSWQNRWFVLTSSSLLYYKKRGDKQYQGVIELSTVSTCTPEKEKVHISFPMSFFDSFATHTFSH